MNRDKKIEVVKADIIIIYNNKPPRPYYSDVISAIKKGDFEINSSSFSGGLVIELDFTRED